MSRIWKASLEGQNNDTSVYSFEGTSHQMVLGFYNAVETTKIEKFEHLSLGILKDVSIAQANHSASTSNSRIA